MSKTTIGMQHGYFAHKMVRRLIEENDVWLLEGYFCKRNSTLLTTWNCNCVGQDPEISNSVLHGDEPLSKDAIVLQPVSSAKTFYGIATIST